MSHSFSYLSSLPLVTDPIAVASNDCAIDRLHKDRCVQAFGRNTLSKPHSMLLLKQLTAALPDWGNAYTRQPRPRTVSTAENNSWSSPWNWTLSCQWSHQQPNRLRWLVPSSHHLLMTRKEVLLKWGPLRSHTLTVTFSWIMSMTQLLMTYTNKVIGEVELSLKGEGVSSVKYLHMAIKAM